MSSNDDILLYRKESPQCVVHTTLTRIRYPGVLIYEGPLGQTLQTLNDAVAIFEVLSDETAATDRVEKLIDYSNVPSLQCYVMLEQVIPAAIVCHRASGGSASGGAWTTVPQTEKAIVLPELNLVLPFEDIYQRLSFPV